MYFHDIPSTLRVRFEDDKARPLTHNAVARLSKAGLQKQHKNDYDFEVWMYGVPSLHRTQCQCLGAFTKLRITLASLNVCDL